MKFHTVLWWLGFSLQLQASLLHELKSPPEFRLADEAFKQRADERKAREALESYHHQWERGRGPEAAWRYAMGCQYVGWRVLKRDEEKLELFARGRDVGRAGIGADPECVACYFWTAVNMALYAHTAGVFRTLVTLPEVKAHLQKVVEKEPSYAYGSALRFLGLIEQNVPGILGGSNARARAYFEQALQIAPDEPLNYLAYAHFLKEELNDLPAWRELLLRSSELTAPTPDRIESVEAFQELRDYRKSQG